MKVFLSMSLVILVWSLYPLLSYLALKGTGPFTILLLANFIAFHGSAAFAIYALYKSQKFSAYIKLQKRIKFDGLNTLLVSGVTSAFSNIFFIIALTMANKNGISLVYEVWPIFAVFFAPYMIDRQWDSLRKRDFVIGIIALFGISLVILSDENINWFAEEKWTMETILAYGMAVLGSYMSAITALQRAQYANKLKELGDSFSIIMISEAGSRFVSVVVTLIALIGIQEELTMPDTKTLVLIFLIGFGTLAVGGSMITYCLLNARSPNISLYYYFVPLLAMFWLTFIGQTAITPEMIIGGIITVGACVFLMYDNSKKPKDKTA